MDQKNGSGSGNPAPWQEYSKWLTKNPSTKCLCRVDFVPLASGIDFVPLASGIDCVPLASGIDFVPLALGIDFVPQELILYHWPHELILLRTSGLIN